MAILQGMEEIIIEEKKYVSSKQAAKITGYAKDYIGQLCREGRVPARLVGRSWYVLESAITDHRFGNPEIEQEDIQKSEEQRPSALPTWEAPRYEAVQAEVLPSINLLREEKIIERDVPEVSPYLQDSWRTWFENTEKVEELSGTSELAASEVAQVLQEVDEVAEELEPEVEIEPEEYEAVSVPLHALEDRQLAREREEVGVSSLKEYLPEQRVRGIRFSVAAIRSVQALGAFAALATVSLAIVGSGYLDSYIISSDQARMAAGVILYNR